MTVFWTCAVPQALCDEHQLAATGPMSCTHRTHTQLVLRHLGDGMLPACCLSPNSDRATELQLYSPACCANSL